MIKLLIFLYYCFISSKITIDDDRKVCLLQNDEKYHFVNCQNENRLIFVQKIELVDLIQTSPNRLCQLKYSNQHIVCDKQDGTSETHDLLPAQINKKFDEIIVGDNFICLYNFYQLSCFGNDNIANIPLIIRTQNFRMIQSLKYRNKNACIFYSIRKSLKYHVRCWGDASTGINQVPIDVMDTDRSLAQLTQIGYNSICTILGILPNQSWKCWGMCLAEICNIPEELNFDLVSLSLGQKHGCAINSHEQTQMTSFNKGILICWGQDSHGETTIPADLKHQVKEVEAGKEITCVVMANGIVQCWGASFLSFNNLKKQIASITTGGRHTCAARRGKQDCWGNNQQGQLNLDNPSYNTHPFIAAGWDFTCFFGKNNQIKCNGFNFHGQLDITHQNLDGDLRSIDAGLNHSCAVQYENTLGSMKCWGGHNEHGQLTTPNSISDVWDVSVGHDFTCLYHSNDVKNPVILCFGNNEHGQSIDQEVTGLVNGIAAGGSHACATFGSMRNIKVNCWGNDSFGQTSPPDSLGASKHLAADDNYSCAVENKNGVVVCWGHMSFRSDDLFARQLSTSYEMFCVVGEQAIAKCWGDDEWGQCQVPDQTLEGF